MDIIKHIEKLIEDGKIKEALVEIKKLFKEKKSHYFDKAILQLARINKLNKEFHSGLIEKSFVYSEMTRIIISTLDLKNILKEIYTFEKNINFVEYLENIQNKYPIQNQDFIPIITITNEGLKKDVIEYVNTFEIPKLIILGGAGMGKSFLLQRLCYLKSNANLFQQINKIPVLIELRYLSIKTSIEDAIVRKLKKERKIVLKLLKEGNLIIFLDGLNEVEENLKLKTKNEIQQILIQYKQAPLIVTCRSEYYRSDEIIGLTEVKISGSKFHMDKYISSLSKSKLPFDLPSPFLINLLKQVKVASLSKLKNEWEVLDIYLSGLLERERNKLDSSFDPNLFELVTIFFSFHIKLYKKANSGFTRYEALMVTEKLFKRFNIKVDVFFYLKKGIDLNLFSRKDDFVTFAHEIYQEYFAASYMFKIPINIRKEEFKEYKEYLVSIDFEANNFWDICMEIDKHSFINHFVIPELQFFLKEINMLTTFFDKFLYYIKSVRIYLIMIKENNQIRIAGVRNCALFDCFRYIGKHYGNKNDLIITGGFIGNLILLHTSYRPDIIIDYLEEYYKLNQSMSSQDRFYIPLFDIIDEELTNRLKKSKALEWAEEELSEELLYYQKIIHTIADKE